MTTIVSALDRIARQCSIKSPTSWVTATSDTHTEIRDDFLLETIEDIQDRVDLASPIGKVTTITGDGSQNYALPSDFRRLQRDPMAVYDVLQDRPVLPISADGTWEFLDDIGTAGVVKYYRVKGYEGNFTIDIETEPATGETFKVSYVSDLWMANGGTAGNAFTAEDDVLLLPRRLVETGVVWRYRERKGLPYQDKWSEYEALMSRLGNDSRGRRTINFADDAAPVRWQDMIPSYIPTS